MQMMMTGEGNDLYREVLLETPSFEEDYHPEIQFLKQNFMPYFTTTTLQLQLQHKE